MAIIDVGLRESVVDMTAAGELGPLPLNFTARPNQRPSRLRRRPRRSPCACEAERAP